VFISNNGGTSSANQLFFCSEGAITTQSSYSPQIACDGSDTCIQKSVGIKGEAAFYAVWGDKNGHLCPTTVTTYDGAAFSNALCACSPFSLVSTCTSCAANANSIYGMNACTPTQVPEDCCILENQNLCNAPNFYSNCGIGTTCCSPICSNLQTDNSNCGSCGNACSSGSTCSTGFCTSVSCGSTFTSPCVWTSGSSSSSISGSTLVLNPASNSQLGQFFNPSPISLAENFRVTFSFSVLTCTGVADGLAFLFVSSLKGVGPYSGGTLGGGIGYNGISQNLAVEFDVFKNAYDPDCHHVAIQSCGNAVNSADHTGPCFIGLQSLASSTSLTGGPHTAIIQYTAAGTSIQVTLNSAVILTKSYNMISAFGTSSVYFGFTSSTGSSFCNFVIDSVSASTF